MMRLSQSLPQMTLMTFSRAAENRFQFLMILRCRAPVRPGAQVAVHNKDQIIEPLARSQGDGSQRLWSSISPSPMNAQIATSRFL